MHHKVWFKPESIQHGKYTHLRRLGIVSSLLFDSDLGHLNDLMGIYKYFNLKQIFFMPYNFDADNCSLPLL